MLYQEKAPKAMAILEAGFDDATAVLDASGTVSESRRTTNALNAEKRNPSQRTRDSYFS